MLGERAECGDVPKDFRATEKHAYYFGATVVVSAERRYPQLSTSPFDDPRRGSVSGARKDAIFASISWVAAEV